MARSQAPKRSLLGILALAALYLVGRALGVDVPLFEGAPEAAPEPARLERSGADVEQGSRQLARLFAERRSDTWVEAAGEVVATLRDDTQGSKHQRFLVRVGPDQTVLIAHNIDLAPRIPLERGDAVRFRGEYEWNDKGGVVHWTHHDPDHRHAGGWIDHAGERYR